jgi:ribonucleoside-diphosphate reductase alpha chain
MSNSSNPQNTTMDTNNVPVTQAKKPGVKIHRRFTKGGENPFNTVQWDKRTSRIRDESGRSIFEKTDAEVPASWSQVATDIMVSKYFRRAGVPQVDEQGKPIIGADGKQVLGSESSAKQVIKRLTNCWRWWGEKYGFFATPDDAKAFEEELQYTLIHQMTAPNSPQWFNTGLALSYDIKGPSQGHFYVDPDDGVLKESDDAYSRPQTSACFIQSVKDSLLEEGGIMDLVMREARVFKYGSGTGTNFSNIREAGAKLSGGGNSSGLMSWLRIFDRAAGAIKSGGTTRRAAKMVILNVDHPDIEEFVWWKANEEKKVAALVAAGYPSDFNGEAYQTVSGQNSNNTVRVSNDFLEAVEKDGEWGLVSRIPGRGIVKTLKARKLWQDISQAAWQSADPGLQYDTTIQEWHTCPASGRINATNPCSEYVFLDDTACNLASINLVKFVNEETRQFDVDSYLHAIRLWTMVLEISVLMSQFPSDSIASNTYRFRTLGLGYANMGTLLMLWGIPYNSQKARAIAGALTATLTGEAYATSAMMADIFGPFAEFQKNREHMLRVMLNHRRAAYAEADESYEGLTVKPVAIDPNICPQDLLTAARSSWDKAVELGEKYGYRNAQVSVLAPTGTIGLLMDCDTTGIEPDFALVKFKKLAGGGYFKIVNQSVPGALRSLGYATEQIQEIVRYVTGTLTFTRAPHINHEALLEKGFSDEDIQRLEKLLPSVFTLDMAFSTGALGEALLAKLDLTEKAKDNPMLDVLRELGFSEEQVHIANEEICGRMTIEGSPHLKPEHYEVFDCANKCGLKGTRYIAADGHIHMLASVQPFVSGSISKTVNMPNEATIEDIENAYMIGWKLGLKCNALYRDGSKLSQPLSTKSKDKEKKDEKSEPCERIVEKIVEKVVERPHRVKLPNERQAITRKVNLAGQEFYVTVGMYPDGKPGEVFITMSQEGTFASGMADAFAKILSIALQYGVPLPNVIRQLRHMRFAPDGFTGAADIPTASSVVDFLAQWLNKTFPDGNWKQTAQLPLPEVSAKDKTDSVHAEHQTNNAQSLGNKENGVGSNEQKSLNNNSIEKLTSFGFTGDKCSNCASMRMVQNGTCKKCMDCGDTTGCS